MQQIWCKELIKEKNISLAFIYKAKSDTDLTLKLAASNEYQLFSNGKFVAYGPMRSAHRYSHVRRYTLTPDEKGNVCAAVIVCSAQLNSFDRVDEPPFFAAEIYSGSKLIARSSDFTAYRLTDRLQKVQRYSFQRTFSESYRLTKDRRALLYGAPCDFPCVVTEEVEGNTLLSDGDLSEPDYHFTAGTPYEAGRAFTDPKREVYHDRSLTGIGCDRSFKRFPMEELEEILADEGSKIVCRPDHMRSENRLSAGRYIAYDLGRNTSGFFNLKVRAAKKTLLYLLFDEIVTPKDGEGLFIDISRLQCCNVIKYVLEEGEYDLISFAPYTAKYVRAVALDGELEISRFGMITLENPDDTFSFTCEDEELVKVIDAARASFRQNAIDVLTDCPSRERAGWLCDSYFTARTEKFLTGCNRVEKNFLEAYLLAPDLPSAKGMIPACYPADHPDGAYIPNWAMWYIIELENFLTRTGDRDFVDRCKEKVYGIIQFLDRYLNEYGLLENLESWIFIEWSKSNEFVSGLNFPSNMLYMLALSCAGRVYDDPLFLSRAEKMKETIRSLSFNGEFFVDQAIRDEQNKLVLTQNITETCQYYAFWTDVADKNSYSALYQKLLYEFADRDADTEYPDIYPSNAFVGRLLRMDYFLREKQYVTVLKEAKTYYLPMAERTGTLWENLTTIASCNHGFSSYIAYILVTAYNALHSA